jgi:hypothetical protein
MGLARIKLRVPAVLFALLLLFALGTVGCGGGQPPKVDTHTPGQRTLKCDNTTITIDPGQFPTYGVDQEAIYVCEDPNHNQVNWTAASGTTFSITFPDNCPFTSQCPTPITDSTPQTVAKQDPKHVTVYKYNMKVISPSLNKEFDPHVVGGGGN